MLLPSALGFSPHPPVSVYGTGIMKTIAAFLDGPFLDFPTFSSVRITLSRCKGGLPPLPVPRLPQHPFAGLHSVSVSPQFCSMTVQELSPAVHRLRISASP